MSTLTVSNVSDGSLSIPTTYVTNGSAKAWAATSGGGTPVVDDSLNVASLTDNGTGDYTLNLTASFANGDYSALGGGERSNSGQPLIVGHITKSAGSTQFYCIRDSGIADDLLEGSFLCHGDLA